MSERDREARASGCAAAAVGVLAWLFLSLVVSIALSYGSADDPVGLFYVAVLLLGPVVGAFGATSRRSSIAGWGYAVLVVGSLVLGSTLG